MVSIRPHGVDPAAWRRFRHMASIPLTEDPAAYWVIHRVFATEGLRAGMGGTLEQRYSTGLTFLDRLLDGGIRAGALLALSAPPGSQSELLIEQFALSRETLYVSTVRPEREVREQVTRKAVTDPDLTVHNQRPEDLLENPARITGEIPPGSFVVVDSVNGLESADRHAHVAFLNDLKASLRDTNSVGVLHCIAGDSSLPRLRDLTLNRADQVWQLQVMSLSRDIKTRLLITKMRNGRAPTEPVDLLMTDRVRVDTSRRIA